jgi:hypothetical protein
MNDHEVEVIDLENAIQRFDEWHEEQRLLNRKYENHYLLVMKKIVDTFEECGCDRTVANGIVNAISQNMIPRVTIDFTQEKQ